MAIIRSGTMTSTGTIQLGNAIPGSVGRWLVTFTDGGSLGSISITPKGTAIGSGESKTAIGYANCTDPTTNINSGSTPITAVGNYLIEASGMDVDLVIGTLSAGTLEWYAVPLRG